MTDTTQDQQFRTAAAKRRMRLCATRYLRWMALEVLPPLEADRYALDMRVPTPNINMRIYAVWRKTTALQLRDCIHDISSTTARCATASMAPGNG